MMVRLSFRLLDQLGLVLPKIDEARANDDGGSLTLGKERRMTRSVCLVAATLIAPCLAACVTGSTQTVTCPNTNINVTVARSLFLSREDWNVRNACQKAIAVEIDKERVDAEARGVPEQAARDSAAAASRNEVSVAARPAQCEMLMDFELTFQHMLDAIAAQAIIHPNGQTTGPFWSKPILGDAEKTQWAITFIENNHDTDVLADMINAHAPVPHDADQSAFFREYRGKQQLILFGRASCAVTVFVINPDVGVFGLSPSRYLFPPGGGVVMLGR
jgi:hypothetical protein